MMTTVDNIVTLDRAAMSKLTNFKIYESGVLVRVIFNINKVNYNGQLMTRKEFTALCN